jgi:RNA polymerase sigma-70 factor (ECF subfamily)
MRAKGSFDHSVGSNEDNAAQAAGSRQTTSEELAKLFESHNQALVRYLAAILGSPDAAGEVAQEAYARILRLDCSETVSHLRAYLFRTARNIAIDRCGPERGETGY